VNGVPAVTCEGSKSWGGGSRKFILTKTSNVNQKREKGEQKNKRKAEGVKDQTTSFFSCL
jgi:hypothetical protein